MSLKVNINDFTILVESKNWSVDSTTKQRLIGLVKKLSSQVFNDQLKVMDVSLFPGYFTTSVFKLVCSQNNVIQNYYIKLAYLPKQHEQRLRQRIKYEYDSSLKIYLKFKDSTFCETVKPIGYFDEEAGFVMQEMHGVRLDVMLQNAMSLLGRKNNDSVYSAMFSAGHWLYEFQQAISAEEKIQFTRKELEDRIQQHITAVNLETSNTLNTNLISKLSKKIEEALDGFNQNDYSITVKHNDYAPWNVMMGDNGIIAFDFADVEYDLKYYDIYHYTRAINSFRLKPINRVKVIQQCQLEFLKGYGLKHLNKYPTEIYFNIYFALERLKMLTRARKRNTGFVGCLRNISQNRHFKWYLKELENIAGL